MERRTEPIEEEINLLDYLIVLAKHKRLIAGITFGTALIAAIVSLLMTPIYKAETRILPPQQGSSSLAMSLLGQMGGMGGMADIAGGALGIKNPSDLYVGILKGRTVLDKIIDRFDLMKLYKADYRVDARTHLSKVLDALSDKKSGIITVSVEDKDPKRAADMANAFVEELSNLNKALATTEAGQRRLFFEEQLKDAKAALTKAEDEVKGFQEKTGAFQMDEQAKAVITGLADLSARIAVKEVELKVLQSFATKQNPDLQKIEEELIGLKAELRKQESKGPSSHDPLMSTGRMPEVGADYVRKMRDLKYDETLYELFAKQYELAKIDEARDAAIIQVIDKAVPPEKRVKPKRTLMVILSAAAGFFISVLAVFFMEFMERASSDPKTRMRLETLMRYAKLRSKE